MTKLIVRELQSFAEKGRGLLFEKEAHSVLLKTRFGIHTFGIKFPIDVLVLDKKHKVVKLVKRLEKNRIFFWNPQYDNVIELPSGEIERKNIRIGESLTIIIRTE